LLGENPAALLSSAGINVEDFRYAVRPIEVMMRQSSAWDWIVERAHGMANKSIVQGDTDE
jgi:hypothetical protein